MHHMPHLHPGEGAPATAALRAVTSCDSSTPIGPAASHDGISDSCLNGTLKEPSTVFETVQAQMMVADMEAGIETSNHILFPYSHSPVFFTRTSSGLSWPMLWTRPSTPLWQP
eukprot:scaffold36984_cov19-Tisochrysis_lutea.AAC.1